MTKYYCLIVTVALLLLSGCNENPSPSPDYMVLDEIVYVKKFPETVQLKDPVQIELEEAFGAIDFIICDSLLIFSTNNAEGMWSFFSLPDYKWLGRFILKGNGPDEFIHMPTVGYNTSFSTRDKTLFAAIYDFAKGRIFEMNVSQTLADNALNINLINDSISRFLSGIIMIDSTTFFCREISERNTKEDRYLLKNGTRNIPTVFEKLNRATIMPSQDINILAAFIEQNDETDRFVELAINLNYINIYSIDGSFGKTICAQNKLDNIREVQQLSMADRMYRHADLRIYSNTFGALCINEDWGTYEVGRKKLPAIQFFDMNGEPLAEFELSRFATSFDIDFNNGYLYTYDHMTEEFYRYDLPDLNLKW